jgi:hypothetical protein
MPLPDTIEQMQIEIRQQRGNDAALRRPNPVGFSSTDRPAFSLIVRANDRCLQPLL